MYVFSAIILQIKRHCVGKKQCNIRPTSAMFGVSSLSFVDWQTYHCVHYDIHSKITQIYWWIVEMSFPRRLALDGEKCGSSTHAHLLPVGKVNNRKYKNKYNYKDSHKDKNKWKDKLECGLSAPAYSSPGQFYTTPPNISFVGILLGWPFKTPKSLGWIPTVEQVRGNPYIT